MGVYTDLLGRQQIAAQQRPGEELITDKEPEGKWKVEERHRIEQALMEGYHYIRLIGVDVLETVDLEFDPEQPTDTTSPSMLPPMHRVSRAESCDQAQPR